MFFHTGLIDLINDRKEALAIERINSNQEINSRTFWGHYTPLHVAIETNQPNIVQSLLVANANVNAITYDNWLTPLHIAAEAGDLRSIQALVKYGPNLNAKTYRDQETALHIVTRLGFFYCVEALLGAGAIVDVQNKDGETPLHIAAKQGDTKLVELLLAKDANPNMNDNKEQTPLFLAAMSQHHECEKLLIKKGAHMGNFLERMKKLQEGYEQECKKTKKLTEEKLGLHTELAFANQNIKELTKKLEALQAMIDNMPTAVPLDNTFRPGR